MGGTSLRLILPSLKFNQGGSVSVLCAMSLPPPPPITCLTALQLEAVPASLWALARASLAAKARVSRGGQAGSERN